MTRIKKYFSIASASLFCYFNTIFGSFAFDDSEAIVKNKDVMPGNPLSDVFTNDFWGMNISLNSSHKSYRPLTVLTFRLNVFLNGSKLSSLQFHLTNVLLYTCLCLLSLPTYEMLIGKKRLKIFNTAFLASILFTVHPIHSEAVASLVGRADILSSILFFMALLLYKRFLKFKSLILFPLIAMVIFAAVLCKETAISVLAICIVYDVINSKILFKSTKVIVKEYKFWCRCSGLMGVGILIMYFRLAIMNFEGPIFTKIDNPAAFAYDFYTRLFSYNYIYFLNLLLLLWPQWLCFDWSMGCIPLIETTCDIRIVFVLILWAFFLMIILKFHYEVKKSRLSKYVYMGLSLFIIPFIPASNLFFKVGFVIAERTLLLPSAGFCLLITLGFEKFEVYFKYKKLHYTCFYLICFIFSLRTILRNTEWLTEERLFESALSICPLNAKVHYNVAKVAADKNNKNLAFKEYEEAIKLNPEYEQAMNNLANLLREEKKFIEAEGLLRRALEIRPNFAAAWMNLGIVLSNLNKSKEAEECYLKAIAYRHKYPDCYYNLGNLYLEQKRNEEALNSWGKAVHFKPTHVSAWSNTLVLLDSLMKYNQVLELGKTALTYNPKAAALHFCVANTLGKIQEFEKAEKHFLEALNLNPKNALYYSNLGVLYHRWGKRDEARNMYRKALQLDPNMKTTENNLRKLLNTQNVNT